jgi:hypothetical protein
LPLSNVSQEGLFFEFSLPSKLISTWCAHTSVAIPCYAASGKPVMHQQKIRKSPVKSTLLGLFPWPSSAMSSSGLACGCYCRRRRQKGRRRIGTYVAREDRGTRAMAFTPGFWLLFICYMERAFSVSDIYSI